EALASEREAEWRRIGAATFLSDDEKRAAVGYGPMKKAARSPCRCTGALKYRPDQARNMDGRWTPEGRAPRPQAQDGVDIVLRPDDDCDA
ncbi:MAG: Phage portal protein family, partial [Hyphomicrobiales bacterium]|nr:Phage portal protein family [Hyphomicrobiales bacterium]